jgi:hypothetical protein
MENEFKKQAVPFTQVPNELLYNPDISFKAKGLWAYMSAKPNGWNFSADRIAKETKEERKSILAGLRELLEAGYLTAKRNGTGRMEYTLLWEPVKPSAFKKPDQAQTDTNGVKAPEPAQAMFPTKTNDVPSPAPEAPQRPSTPAPQGLYKPRPKRGDYDSGEEFEKAFYDWNSL